MQKLGFGCAQVSRSESVALLKYESIACAGASMHHTTFKRQHATKNPGNESNIASSA